MTNEEALAHFKNHEYMTDFSWQDEMSEVAIKAIERQIPKKPLEITFMGEVRCPACQKWMGHNQVGDFCLHCGQKIDWEKADEN